MRPHELTLEGFRSHRQRAVFDFRGRRLVGVVGPIGSGKSSLLEAVVFALYGKTPTFERETRSLIHQLADGAQVQLVFEVDGQVWRATRAIRRKGQSQHKLEHLHADDPEADVLETIVQERPVRERIEQLLGLDFSAFCRSVMLAQGRFQEFLHATPRERTDVLKGVFGYERFDAALVVARERAAAAEGELTALMEEGTHLEEARTQLEVARAEGTAATARHHELEAAAARIGALTQEVRGAEHEAQRARGRAQEAASLARSLPHADDVATIVERAEITDAVVREDEDTLATAGTSLADAEASAVAVAERVGGRDAVGVIADVVARLDHEATAVSAARQSTDAATHAVRDAEQEREARQAEHTAAADDESQAARAIVQTAATAAEADAALHEARHADMATELRRGLAEGRRCPVCAQVVMAIPRAARAPKLTAAENALTEARGAEQDARAAHVRTTQVAAAAAERLAAAEGLVPRRREELGAAELARRGAEAACGATQSELVDHLGEGDPRALLAARRRELEEAERAVEEARAAERDARATLDEARSDGKEADVRLEAVRDLLLATWGRVGEMISVPSQPAGVRAAFEALGEQLAADLAEADADTATADDAVATHLAALGSELANVGLHPDDDIVRVLGEAKGTEAAAAQRVADLEATLARGSDLEARLGGAVDRRDLARRLTADLQPSKFLGFVLEEERRALAELGSHHFEELTDGAYRFTDDDRFYIIDVNAAATERSADSLSGGETFLASLALALALAEMVTRGGGRLDSFFLDEGFGSLDPEHLDRAMDGIARLVAGDADRLVVLVSHVEQMRQTLEDLVILDKDPRTGDTLVLAGARREP